MKNTVIYYSFLLVLATSIPSLASPIILAKRETVEICTYASTTYDVNSVVCQAGKEFVCSPPTFKSDYKASWVPMKVMQRAVNAPYDTDCTEDYVQGYEKCYGFGSKPKKCH